MKILIAHFLADIVSGAELAIADMVAKRSEGIEYLMLTPGEGKLADYYRTRGFTVRARSVPTRRRKYPGLHALQSLWFAHQLKHLGVDAVLCNTFPAASRVGTSCRLARKPHAIYVREYIRNTPQHRRILGEAQTILAVSRDVEHFLKALAPTERIGVAYDHLDTGPILERVQRHKVTGKRLLPFIASHPVVGFVGRITPYKQPDLFLRAISAIRERKPEARFVVVGCAVEREQNYGKELKRLAMDLGVADYVVFMGQRPDVIEILSELTVFCLTSDREPFPRTILEAQVVGCPVVASDTGGCPEMVQDGVTGILSQTTAPNAAQGLANEVIRVLDDPSLARGLATRALETVRSTFGSRTPVVELEARLRVLAERK